jgi:hypothetical protein
MLLSRPLHRLTRALFLLLQERVPGATRVVDKVCTEGSTVVAAMKVRAVL